MSLGNPNTVVITGDVLSEQAQRDGLVEGASDTHVRSRPDASDLLDILSQERVATSRKRLQCNAFTKGRQVTGFVEEGAFAILGQGLLDLVIAREILTKKHFFEIRELDFRD